MVLDELTDGASRLLLDDDGVRELLFILCLPLMDGVFATLLVTGAVQTFSDFLTVGVTIFSGAGAIAVLYSYSETAEEARDMVLRVAPFLVAGAVLVALVAPVFRSMFYIETLKIAAGLVLVFIAAQLVQARYAEKFPPHAVMLTGMILSLKNPAAVALSTSYVVPAVMTALVAVAVLYLSAFLGDRDLTLVYVRRGAASVLLLIALSLFGLELPSELGIAVFTASVAASIKF